MRESVLRYSIILSLVPTLTLMAFIQTQMPVFVAEDLGDSEGALLGFMFVGMGVGGFIGAVLVARFHSIEHKGRLSLIGVAGAAVAVLALSQVDVWWHAWIILVAQQLFFIMVMTTNNTILQSVTPDYMRGRVMGIYMLDIGMQPMGGVVAGLIAESYSVSTAWIIGGAVGLALVTLIAVTAPFVQASAAIASAAEAAPASSASRSGGTVRRSSRERARPRCAQPQEATRPRSRRASSSGPPAADVSMLTSRDGSSSVGRLPPPSLDGPSTTDARSPIRSATTLARSLSSSCDAEIMRQTGIRCIASPRT